MRANGHGLLTGFARLLTPMTMQWTNKTFPSEQEHMQDQNATSMGHWMDMHPPHPGLNLFNFIVFLRFKTWTVRTRNRAILDAKVNLNVNS